MRKILITGASVAGPALAFWLAGNGHDVTVLERAEAFRDGGQNIDVRGAAREALARMGLVQSVKDHGTGEKGIRFVDVDDATVAKFDQEAFGADGPTAELEILRGDLAKILVDASREAGATYQFGDHIVGIAQDEAGIEATFASGSGARFDAVIAAEGIGSSTRKLLFGEDAKREPVGLYMAYFTIPRGDGDGEMARWYAAPGGRSLLLRPDRHGTTRVVMTLRQEPCGYEDLAPDEQREALIERFADAGWETPRIVDGLRGASDFYFEMIGQIRIDRWSLGRVALTGDAAWAPGPVSGKGTSLGLIGAYVLAGELIAADDVDSAFLAYERIMRPIAEAGQDFPRFGPRLLQPSTRFGIALQHVILGVAASPLVRTLSTKFLGTGAEDPPLLHYAMKARPIG